MVEEVTKAVLYQDSSKDTPRKDRAEGRILDVTKCGGSQSDRQGLSTVRSMECAEWMAGLLVSSLDGLCDAGDQQWNGERGVDWHVFGGYYIRTNSHGDGRLFPAG